MTDFLVVSDYSEITSWPEMKYKTSALSPGTKPTYCLVYNCVLSGSWQYNGMPGQQLSTGGLL